MGMSEFYGTADEGEAIATIHRALELGVNFLDTADAYGPFKNERLVGRAIKDRRDEVVLATKFGSVRTEQGERLGIRGDREYVLAACNASLERLGTDHIDVYYQHRVDPNTPIEETVGAMAELVEQGKVRYLGLSEAAEVANLPLLDELGHGADGLLDRRVRIDAMLVVDVDVVGAEPLERGVTGGENVLAVAADAEPLALLGADAAELCREHDLVAAVLDRAADEPLVLERPVRVGRVEEVDAE